MTFAGARRIILAPSLMAWIKDSRSSGGTRRRARRNRGSPTRRPVRSPFLFPFGAPAPGRRPPDPRFGIAGPTGGPPSEHRCSSDLHACPCGYYGDTSQRCTCSESAVTRYQHRISGPLLDRIDIFIDVPRVDYEKLTDAGAGEGSAEVRARIQESRELQRRRFSESRLSANAEMGPVEVREFCQRFLDEAARALLRTAVNQLALSARAFHRVLKVGRTVADLGHSEVIAAAHIAEALQYRQRGQG